MATCVEPNNVCMNEHQKDSPSNNHPCRQDQRIRVPIASLEPTTYLYATCPNKMLWKWKFVNHMPSHYVNEVNPNVDGE